MNNFKTYTIISALLLLSTAVGADDSTTNEFSGKVEAGYHAVGRTDSLEKTAEFDSARSSATGGVDLSLSNENMAFRGRADYTDSDEYQTAGSVDVSRIFKMEFNHDSFLHRTRHDSFHEKDPKALLTGTIKPGTPDATFATAEHNGAPGYENMYSGVTAANPVPVKKEDGSLVTEGFQTATFNDLDMSRNYSIRRMEQEWKASLQLPAFPNLVPEIQLKRQQKDGWKQHSLSVGQCTPCHAVAVGKKIDYTTDDLKFGATYRHSNVSFSYFHGITKFDSGKDLFAHNGFVDNDYWFDAVPGTGATPDARRSRELYDNQHAAIGDMPDTNKHTDTFKLRIDAPNATTIYSSAVFSRTENDSRDNEYKTNTYYLSLNNRMIPKLNLKAFVKYYTLDNDDIAINLANYANDKTVLFTADPINGSQPVTFWDYERLSTLSRNVTETGLNFGYGLRHGYHLTGGYTYKIEDRDNRFFKDFYSPKLIDHVYLEDEKTQYHILDLGLSGRPIKTVNARIDYRFQHVEDPFMYYHGLGYTTTWIDLYPNDGVDMASQNTPFYQIFRSIDGPAPQYTAGRTASGSNVAENQHRIKATATWMANDWLSFQVNGMYLNEKNDVESDWSNKTWNGGISSHILMSKKLSFSLGYDYQKSSYETKYSTPTYIGCFSESMSGQIASRYADVDNDIKVHMLYLSSTYKPIQKLKLYGDIIATWSKANLSVPDFGPNQVYVYFPNTGFPYSYSIMRNYLDYTGSDLLAELDYRTVDLVLGGEMELYRGVALNVNGGYRKLSDKKAYLGSDLDGEMYMINTALVYRF